MDQYHWILGKELFNLLILRKLDKKKFEELINIVNSSAAQNEKVATLEKNVKKPWRRRNRAFGQIPQTGVTDSGLGCSRVIRCSISVCVYRLPTVSAR